MRKFIYQARGWVFIRPLRWLSAGMARGSFRPRWFPEKDDMYHPDFWPHKYKMPNFHWWFLYKTLGRAFLWLNRSAWRHFCDWTGGYRRTFPWPARAIMKIGQTLSYNFVGGECYHCASNEGNPSDLADDDNYFVLTDSGTSSTENGTDHWFRGITTCPKCGFKDEFGDSSL